MNWIQHTKNDDLLIEYTAKLAQDLAKEAGTPMNGSSDEECQQLGTQLTSAWFEGKTQDEVVDYLVNKYGTETEKLSYKEWLIERS